MPVRLVVIALTCSWFPSVASALEPRPGCLFVRVVDVGAGHCSVIVLPDGRILLYDAGNFEDEGSTVLRALPALASPRDAIELMVISHAAADSLGAAGAILQHRPVRHLVRTGYPGRSAAWKDFDRLVRNMSTSARPHRDRSRTTGMRITDLRETELLPGSTLAFGEVLVTFLSGFHEPPRAWGLRSLNSRQNAGSIVMRVAFAGRAILFCGDVVGRHPNSPAATCIAAEEAMLHLRPAVRLQADVMVAPHHGSDLGSSQPFIAAVDPVYAIFAAGHAHEHPRATTAQRFIDHGLPPDHLLRTDRGDDEGGREWAFDRQTGMIDPLGDDDVDVLVTANGDLTVAYRVP